MITRDIIIQRNAPFLIPYFCHFHNETYTYILREGQIFQNREQTKCKIRQGWHALIHSPYDYVSMTIHVK